MTNIGEQETENYALALNSTFTEVNSFMNILDLCNIVIFNINGYISMTFYIYGTA